MGDLITLISVLGGFEAIKWTVRFFTNRSNQKSIDDTEAISKLYEALENHISFLQGELQEKEKRFVDKEQRFVEQTDRLRNIQDQMFELQRKNADLEIQLALKRCEVKKCSNREPQNGY